MLPSHISLRRRDVRIVGELTGSSSLAILGKIAIGTNYLFWVDSSHFFLHLS